MTLAVGTAPVRIPGGAFFSKKIKLRPTSANRKEANTQTNRLGSAQGADGGFRSRGRWGLAGRPCLLSRASCVALLCPRRGRAGAAGLWPGKGRSRPAADVQAVRRRPCPVWLGLRPALPDAAGPAAWPCAGPGKLRQGRGAGGSAGQAKALAWPARPGQGRGRSRPARPAMCRQCGVGRGPAGPGRFGRLYK